MYALEFMDDLRSRLAYRIQLTTDGYTSYQGAVEGAFGGYVDYAQAVKLYDDDSRLVGTRRTVIVGAPSLGDTTTSPRRATQPYDADVNETLHEVNKRHSPRSFVNHCYAQALYFVWYNFCRKHRNDWCYASNCGWTSRQKLRYALDSRDD